MDSLLRDLRFAVRGLVRAPGFTAAAVLALALGIGATTAIFTVVHAVLLRSFGWGDESRLLALRADFPGNGVVGFTLSVAELEDLRTSQIFAHVGGYTRGSAALLGERPERVRVAQVTAGFFEALSVPPFAGRGLTAAEDRSGQPRVALLSYATWKKRYGGDLSAIGKTVTLDGNGHQIVGILPAGFSYDGPNEFFLPFAFTQEQLLQQRGAHYLEGVGQLAAGVPAQRALAQLGALSERVRLAYPNEYSVESRFRFSVQPLRDRFVAASRQPLLLLLAAVVLVLLIACGNVANLLLARAAHRERELALRAALGAGRGRLVRQLLTESALLAAVGAVLGVLVASWGLDLLLAAAPVRIRELTGLGVDQTVLAFAAGTTVATTLLFGFTPALRQSRPDLAGALKDGAHATGGPSAGKLRSALVVAQVALSLLVLAGAGLVLRSFVTLLQVSPGFDPEGVLVARLEPTGAAYDDDDAARGRYFERALQAAAALPGVQSVGGIDRLPVEGRYQLSYFIEGYLPAPGEPQPSNDVRRVAPGYFKTVRQRVTSGREFSAADDARAPLVALVNEAWVRRYFPGRDVLGQRLRLDSTKDGKHRTIVGVVADAHERGLDQQPVPVYDLPVAQLPPDQLELTLRASRPEALLASARDAFSRIDASQPVGRLALLEELASAWLAPRRFPLQLLAAFAALALVLSALGIYGVTSYAVAMRTREIGVRMAIGASASSVVRMVLVSTLRLVALGLAVGLAAALALGHLLASQLYGVSAHDPLTYAAIATLLALVALAASGLPALRAARVDPMTALRAE